MLVFLTGHPCLIFGVQKNVSGSNYKLLGLLGAEPTSCVENRKKQQIITYRLNFRGRGVTLGIVLLGN